MEEMLGFLCEFVKECLTPPHKFINRPPKKKWAKTQMSMSMYSSLLCQDPPPDLTRHPWVSNIREGQGLLISQIKLHPEASLMMHAR